MRNAILSALGLCLIAVGEVGAQPNISIGIYGGLNAPVIQQDTRSGPGFGAKLTITPVPLLAIAGFYERRQFGDPTRRIFRDTPLERTIVIDGGRVDVIGIQAQLGDFGRAIGPRFYWMAGLGNYRWTRADREDFNEMFFHVGPGLELAVSRNLGIDINAKLEVVPTDGGGSRKNFLALIGANYHFDM